MSPARTALRVTAAFVLLLPPAARGDAGTDAQQTPAASNLCLPACAPRFEGSMGMLVTDAFLRGKAELRQISMPPQDLVIHWPKPVTIHTHVIEWHNDKVYAVRYGLEYWDAGQKRYRLVYEAKDNRAARAVHDCRGVTTTRVRFTVFDHPLAYDSVILRAFALYGQ